MKKFLLVPLILLTFILGNSFFSQNADAMTPNPNCTYDNNNQAVCPSWQLAPDYCANGTLIPGGTNECGCEQPPSCELPSPVPTSTVVPTPTPSPIPTGSPAPSPYPSPPVGCFYQSVQCIQAPCDPILVCPSPTPTPTPTTLQFCQSDTDCSNNEFCYQPPMPYCPIGAYCAQVMPAQYCKLKETVTNNKVSFATAYAKLSADNFYIETNGKKFIADDPNITVHSDPGSDIYTTLEITWSEQSIPMRMYIYFKYTPGGFWEVTELRTYDGTSSYKQLYYPGFTGNELGNPLIMSVFDLTSKDGLGKVHFENLNLQAFLSIDHKPPSEFGYYIEKKPVTEDIEVFLMGPYHGYGVNAVLRDSDDNIVTDLSPFHYVWTSLNNDIVSVSSNAIESMNADGTTYCLYGVNKPCPESHADISYHGIGTGIIKVQVMNQENKEVASEEFTFTVKQKSADLNKDGKVNIMDYTILSSQFMRTDYPVADINADGKVNLMDFTLMMGQFNPNIALP
ncbi:MAG: dockerin type I repeat-containing protein [Candidatus Pacebacteria bacterium]|nr:dockerin type I repeat-containing protein [Candidatus Paceibacterota bacterium]